MRCKGGGAQGALDAEAAEHLHGVRHHLNARPNARELRCLLVDAWFKAHASQGGRGRKAADPGSDDGDRKFASLHGAALDPASRCQMCAAGQRGKSGLQASAFASTLRAAKFLLPGRLKANPARVRQALRSAQAVANRWTGSRRQTTSRVRKQLRRKANAEALRPLPRQPPAHQIRVGPPIT